MCDGDRQDLYERWRVRQPGETWRRPITWRDDFGLAGDVWGNRWKGFVALHRDREGIWTYVRYRGEQWVERQPRHVPWSTTSAVESSGGSALAVSRVHRSGRDDPADDARPATAPWLLTNRRAASQSTSATASG
jgi:hypothetical protein